MAAVAAGVFSPPPGWKTNLGGGGPRGGRRGGGAREEANLNPPPPRRRALEAGRGFVVCVGDSVEPGVQRILDITGLVPVLPVVSGRTAAIDAARESANGNGAPE